MTPVQRNGCSRVARASPETSWLVNLMRMEGNDVDPHDWESARAEQSVPKVKRNSSISFLFAITGLSAQKGGDFMAFKMTEGRLNKHESKG